MCEGIGSDLSRYGAANLLNTKQQWVLYIGYTNYLLILR